MKLKIEVEILRHTSSVSWTYSQLDSKQREIADRVRKGGRGALLLSEVAPVITRGRRTQNHDLLTSEEELRRLGISSYLSDRGGLATYHGLGQWLLFAVDRLENLTGDRRGVRKGVEGLLEIAWKVGLQYYSHCQIRSGNEMGVWTPRGKFAAVGIHIEQGVLLHGLAVNGFRTSQSFVGLRPCGLDAPVDFLLDQPFESDFLDLGNRLIREALQKFWNRS